MVHIKTNKTCTHTKAITVSGPVLLSAPPFLFKKIRATKGTFHAKMGTIKDRNGMDLTEAEDIKKRWQEYTEELYKKDLHDPDNHDGVITHLARHPGMQSQVGVRKHHHKQS